VDKKYNNITRNDVLTTSVNSRRPSVHKGIGDILAVFGRE